VQPPDRPSGGVDRGERPAPRGPCTAGRLLLCRWRQAHEPTEPPPPPLPPPHPTHTPCIGSDEAGCRGQVRARRSGGRARLPPGPVRGRTALPFKEFAPPRPTCCRPCMCGAVARAFSAASCGCSCPGAPRPAPHTLRAFHPLPPAGGAAATSTARTTLRLLRPQRPARRSLRGRGRWASRLGFEQTWLRLLTAARL
jgi:hypothetical protein